MSKKKRNYNVTEMKQLILNQQREIEQLKYYVRTFRLTWEETHNLEMQQFYDIITCIFDNSSAGIISQEQAGQLMFALVDKLHDPNE